MDRFEAGIIYTTVLEILYLHSSMDRFEDMTELLKLNVKSNLHSSMDRFEGGLHAWLLTSYPYLHSSMDRFEANEPEFITKEVILFTFQYG